MPIVARWIQMKYLQYTFYNKFLCDTHTPTEAPNEKYTEILDELSFYSTSFYNRLKVHIMFFDQYLLNDIIVLYCISL